MVEADHVDTAPGGRAVLVISTTAICRHANCITWWSRTIDAGDVEVGLVFKNEIGTALSHWQMLSQMPIGTQGAKADF